jgi:hypothetical protein
MFKNQKNIIIIIFLSAIVLASFFFDFYENKKKVDIEVIKQEIFEEEIVVKEEPINQIKEHTNNISDISKKEINISLSVLDKNYIFVIEDGNTVYEAMKNLQNNKENNFSFEYKEYPSLGVFVEKINGVKGESGKYWIYYVNDKQAQVGVSKYVLKEGDIISWRQE